MIISIPTHPNANSYLTVEEANELMEGHPMHGAWDAKGNEEKEGLLKMATRQIDTLRFHHHRFFHNVVSPTRALQALQFPRSNSTGVTGVVDDFGTTDGKAWVIDASLVYHKGFPDSRWIGAGIRFNNGNQQGKVYLVTAYDYTTGKLTFDTDFEGTAPAVGDAFHVVEGVPSAIKNATLEQALYIMNGGGQRARLQAEGVKSYSIGDLSETFGNTGVSGKIPLSPEARAFLAPYISKIGRLI